MRSVDGVIRELLGREFEIECSRIEVLGRDDHEEPDYSGPGVLSGVNVRRVRDGQIESESAYRDQSKLSFDDTVVTIAIEKEQHRTTVTSTHGKDWAPPICEVGLADALAFVAAAPIRPRISIR